MKGKRKLVFYAILSALATGAKALGFLTDDAYALTLQVIAGSFGIGNGLEHIGNKEKKDDK